MSGSELDMCLDQKVAKSRIALCRPDPMRRIVGVEKKGWLVSFSQVAARIPKEVLASLWYCTSKEYKCQQFHPPQRDQFCHSEVGLTEPLLTQVA